MSHLKVFFTTQIVEKPPSGSTSRGILHSLGNVGLAPLRYLFNGRTVEVVTTESIRTISCEPSFEKSWLKTLLAIVGLVTVLPWLLGSFCKALSYGWASTRQLHAIAKEHFAPIQEIELEIGNADDLKRQLDACSIRQHPHPRLNLILNFIESISSTDMQGALGVFETMNPARLILAGTIPAQEAFLAALSQNPTVRKSPNWIFVRQKKQKELAFTSVDSLSAAKNLMILRQPKFDGSGQFRTAVICVR